MKQFPRSMTTGSGSTGILRRASLIDVAGAVTALGMLSLLLVPALGGVRRSSKNERCLSNLMRIGYANAVYAAQDLADMAIPVHHLQFNQCPGLDPNQLCTTPIFVGAYEWGGKSGVGQDEWLTGTPGSPLGSKYGTFAGFGPASRPLNRVIYPNEFEDHLEPPRDRPGALKDTQLELDGFECPADTGYTGAHCPGFQEQELSSFDHFGTSYTANIFMTSNAGGGEMFSTSPYLHRMAEVRNPARTLAYQENNGRWAWAVAPSPCDFLDGVEGPVGGWHGKDWTFNAAFIDGHVDAIYMRGYRNELVFPENEDFQSGFRCIIIRGEGWQLDVLPTPRVATGVLYNGDGRASYEGCLTEFLPP